MNFGNRWCEGLARHERGRADPHPIAVGRAVMVTSRRTVAGQPAGVSHAARSRTYLRLSGRTLPALGLVMSSAYMPRRKLSMGLPMRSRKAARDVTTWLRVMGVLG